MGLALSSKLTQKMEMIEKGHLLFIYDDPIVTSDITKTPDVNSSYSILSYDTIL